MCSINKHNYYNNGKHIFKSSRVHGKLKWSKEKKAIINKWNNQITILFEITTTHWLFRTKIFNEMNKND